MDQRLSCKGRRKEYVLVVRLLLTRPPAGLQDERNRIRTYYMPTSTLHAWSGLERILLSHKQSKHRMHLLQVIFGNLL